jgi:hypothetical protein
MSLSSMGSGNLNLVGEECSCRTSLKTGCWW